LNQTERRVERREFPRVAIALDVEVAVPGDEALVSASTLDLSMGGVLVRADRAFAAGDTLLLAVSGPEERVVVAHGEVVSSTALVDEGAADSRVRFVGLSRSRREALARLLAAAASEGEEGHAL
jgi:c-di-GMP-binding flagellar brake protein YcgR